jgi:type II secretory pathway predicted ATPase ExeA
MRDRTPKVPIIVQVADILRRARKLPPGPARNDLRQVARGLLNLHRAGIRANVQIVEEATTH